MSRQLYLECYSGISGDMTVAALLDLGASEEVLNETLDSLMLDEFTTVVGSTYKCGIGAKTFDVRIPADPHYDEGHGMDGEHHHHDHDVRNLDDIYEILDRLEDSKVRRLAKKIFRIVAVAESEAHQVPMEEVHFHEVGAVDSIVDIVAAATLVVNLGVDDVVISPLYEGRGHVWCQHGRMPVPAPATLNIISAEGLTLHLTETEGEMITPTGAAIAAALRTRDKLPAEFTIQRIGIGAGKKDFKHANVLRAMLIEA